MDTVNMKNYIEAWLANNAGRANNLSIQIQRITDEYLEICIDGKLLQIAIPHNFHTSCSSNGIISNADCGFIATLTNATDPDLMIALNDKLDLLNSRGFYSFTSVLDSIVDVFEKYNITSTERDGADCGIDIDDNEDEEEENGWSSDDDGYSMALGEGKQRNGYLEQLIEDANKKCDAARSRVVEVPGSDEKIKDDILRWCKVYSSAHSEWCVRFEIELAGILSRYTGHRQHVYEALGFSLATPLVIEVTFQPLGSDLKSTSLEAQGESLSGAFERLWAMHVGLEYKVPPIEKNFVSSTCDGQENLDDQLSRTNPMHLYGLRSLLPRMAQDFFSRGGRDRDPNVLLAREDNIFVRFLLFTASRFASLFKRCIVCNKGLPFTVSRLCSCADELCLFGFEVLGLGAQVLPELVRMPLELIDLEISLASAAANGYRDVFEPFPPFLLQEREIRQRSKVLNDNDIENPNDNPTSMSNPRNKNKNMDALRSIIKSFPPVSEMRLCADEAELRVKLGKSWLSTAEAQSLQKLGDEYFGKEAWQLPYDVLRFILCTNRLSLVFLSEDDDKLIKFDNSRLYQFAVVQDSPEREAMYTSKNKHEVSRFGFHGSVRENWYSILRNGLRCLTDTKLMTTGKTKGEGIYLADTLELATTYARYWKLNNRWNDDMVDEDGGFYVVGLYEVISSSIKEEDGYCVVPKESEGNVAVRYLLVNFSDDMKGLIANISDGRILSHGGHSVDLSQHHQSIRRKYDSISCSQ
eukprot:PITA_13918